VARLGGDEFAVLVVGSADRARAVAQRVSERIAKPVVVGGRRFLVSSSIGVVLASSGDESAHALLSHADIALYEAKARDKGGIVVIQGEARAAAARQVYLREQIAQPKLDQFSVVYQPIVDLHTGRIRGLEALLRWMHPELGAVSPADFVPLAEHGGSISILGWHVLETALADLGRWQREHPADRLAVGVNVSVLQLDDPGFAERVLATVDAAGVARDQLVVELTEQALARDFETAVAVVAELRRGGVSVAVDDYGTGYSSLRYLHRFDADVVKIDRSFIANLGGSEHTQKIVRSVVDMAASLDLQCIAEGIETVEQLALVRDLGCELGQGFLFARPLDRPGIDALLEEHGFDVSAPARIPQPRQRAARAAL
jgi:predicted signal transduction protein with EAL and GGDEF domain